MSAAENLTLSSPSPLQMSNIGIKIYETNANSQLLRVIQIVCNINVHNISKYKFWSKVGLYSCNNSPLIAMPSFFLPASR